jgi:hypothetical protein
MEFLYMYENSTRSMYGNLPQVHFYQMHVREHLQGTHQPVACMGISSWSISTRCMCGNIYQVHVYQMHVWEHPPCTGYLLDALMGTSTRYISTRRMYGNIHQVHSTRCMYGNIHQVHIYQVHVWEHPPGTHLLDACMGTSTRYLYGISTRCM